MGAQVRLGGRGEKRRLQLVGVHQAGGELVAADRARGLVVLEARARQVPAHDALDGQGLGLAHDHGPAFQFVGVWGQGGREIAHVSGQKVVGGQVLEGVHPVQGDLVQDHALVGYGFVHDDVKGRHAVRGHDEQGLRIDFVDVAHFSARDEWKLANLGLGHYLHGFSRRCSTLRAWASSPSRRARRATLEPCAFM